MQSLVDEFYEYMKNNGASERHMNNNLKPIMGFANFIGPEVSFFDIQQKQQIVAFLDTKIKTLDEDLEKKWITTWNHYLGHLKYFFRWLHNYRIKNKQNTATASLGEEIS